MINFTYNTKLIFQNNEDKQKIIQMLKAQRLAWNECSKVRFESVPKNSIVDLHKVFYKQFREKHQNIPSQVVISAQQSVLSAYRSIKSNKHKIKIPCKKHRLSIRLDHNTYSYKNNRLSIISLEKRVKCQLYIYPKLQEYLNKYQFCDPLLFVKNNEIWIALTFKIQENISQNSLSVGIDVGCRINAATSEGNLYIDRKFNAEKRRLRYLKRCLQSKSDKGSKSAKRHLKKLRYRESNKNKNFSHHLSKKIIKDTNANVIVLENLKSIKVRKHRYQSKNRISQVPLYQLKQFLSYKAPIYGKTVISVCASYTSQIDSQTGKRDGKRQGRRYYSKNGKIYDADVNAAINIATRSKLPVSYSSDRITYGQANVKSPIMGKTISRY